MPIAAVVADANVLLSAVVGKAARRVFDEFDVVVHVAAFTCGEVEEYLPLMAEKYHLERELVFLSWRLLPFQRHSFAKCERYFRGALAAMKSRDPEDAHALALARRLRLPLWSNDRDLKIPGQLFFPTAKLLSALERGIKS